MSKPKITIHWTAGNLVASDYDLKHYHFVVDSEGVKRNIDGLTPAHNLNCANGEYVAHCRGCNTNNTGVAAAGFFNGIMPSKKTFEKMFKFVASLMFIQSVELKEVKTHAERNVDKIDFDYLPDYWGIGEINGVENCSNFIRNKVKWYYSKI